MKRLFLLIAIFYSLNCFSQQHSITIEELSKKIDYTNKCLYKHRNEKMLGTGLFLFGGLFGGLSQLDEFNGKQKAAKLFQRETSAADSYEEKIYASRKYTDKVESIDRTIKSFLIAGSITAFAGTLIEIDSYKWLKRAYIGENGIGLKFKLNK